METLAHTDFDGFCETVLAPGERADTVAERARAWTRKEAVLKAVGTGLSVDPRHVDVRASLVSWPAIVRVQDVAVDDDHRAAVAVVGSLEPSLDLRPMTVA